MTLDSYLKKAGVKPPEFAKTLGVRLTTVYRYLSGRVPETSVMKRIIEVTSGEVTPNDFYSPGELVCTPPRKRRLSPRAEGGR